jgi:hypothetical protein
MTKKSKTLKLSSDAQIDGKAQENAPRTAYGSLDQILGENIGMYSAKSCDEYRAQIVDMNQTDLQSHALKIGLIPVEDRKVLTDRLVQEFERWQTRSLPQGVVGGRSIGDIDEKTRKILREGA